MEVINHLLNYKDLKIVQNSEWFSFSLDSVLLADFTRVNNKMKIIDFCCGNAPIPLFLSTKTKAKITGVELQKEVYELAKKSISLNKLDDQIEMLNIDVKNIANLYDTDIFDLITCNPPYFKLTEKSNTNLNNVKATARHEISLTLNDIFKCAKKLLKNNGKIVMVHRTERLIEIISEMKNNNIEPKRIKLIYPFLDSESNMVLIEGTKNGKPGIKIEKSLIIHNTDGSYRDDVLKIFNGG